MRACLGCGRPVAKGSRCPTCKRENAQLRKVQGLTGERGSTHASRLRRANVLARANGCCFYCLAPADKADHYIPLAKGGPDSEENMVAACGPCNSTKSDQMPADFMDSHWLARRCEEVAAARRAA
jgi:5-methylcytosine-specific restriction endonuclease McrA